NWSIWSVGNPVGIIGLNPSPTEFNSVQTQRTPEKPGFVSNLKRLLREPFFFWSCGADTKKPETSSGFSG
ncbi:MAG: hypothetical protein LPK24_11420, partial [Marinobacter sp.]|uniref:hypothetical protein n=1 Tax=Marinobacter sp. TaxID=50741 RepID=UPI0029C35EB1